MMPKIDRTNWFVHVKDPNDFAEYMTMFENTIQRGINYGYEHEEHLASMAQAEQDNVKRSVIITKRMKSNGMKWNENE